MSAVIKEIGGRKFAFSKMSASRALRVHTWLAGLVGDLLAQAFADPKKLNDVGAAAKGLSADQETAIIKALGVLLKDVDPDVLEKMMLTVLEPCNFEIAADKAAPIKSIDATFGTDAKSMYIAFWEGLKLNFEGFFPDGALDSLLSKIKERAPSSSSPSPT